MRSTLLPLAAAALSILTLSAQAQDAPKADEALRQKRLEMLEERVDGFTFELAQRPGEKLERSKQPILRWSNPVRDYVNDGVTFLILERERPHAVVNIWARSRDPKLDSGEVLWELIALGGQALTCRRDGRLLWSPKSGALVDKPLADAPPPAERALQRLVQMRDLARRFKATTTKARSPHEMRLLPQPLYRYADAEADVLDGALFVFAEGNDPEVLLRLEASTAGKDQWRYSLARMTTFPVTVRLDDQEVLALDAYPRDARKTEDPYTEAVDEPFSLRE